MLSMGRPDVHQCDSGWVPVYTDAQKSLALMSIGFLLEDPDEAVVWRGPKKTGRVACSPLLVEHIAVIIMNNNQRLLNIFSVFECVLTQL